MLLLVAFKKWPRGRPWKARVAPLVCIWHVSWGYLGGSGSERPLRGQLRRLAVFRRHDQRGTLKPPPGLLLFCFFCVRACFCACSLSVLVLSVFCAIVLSIFRSIRAFDRFVLSCFVLPVLRAVLLFCVRACFRACSFSVLVFSNSKSAVGLCRH